MKRGALGPSRPRPAMDEREKKRAVATFLLTCGMLASSAGAARAQTKFEFRDIEEGKASDDLGRQENWGELVEGTPEYRVGCAVPSPQACKSLSYLATNCGKLQLEHTWTCHDLYGADFDSKSSAKRVSIIDPKLTPVGIDVVVTQDASKDEASYDADLSSYVSAQNRVGMGISQEVGIDPYASYSGAGTKVYTCNEYVAKKTWSVSSLELHVGAQRQDLRFVVDQAFASSGADWAMAKKHGALKGLYDIQGNQFAAMFPGVATYKNRFVAPVLANPLTKTGESAPGPSLTTSFVQKFGLWGAIMLAAIDNVADKTAVDSWARQTTLAKSLSYEGSRGISSSFAVQQPDEPDTNSFQNLAADDVEALAEVLGTTAGAPRRYLDEELNELYDLQERLRKVYQAWAALNVRYKNSGWNPTEVAPVNQGGGDQGGTGSFANAQPAQPNAGGFDLIAIDPETSARSAVLTELKEVLNAGYQAGCIADGITPCDWSPRQFAERVFHRFAPLKDDLMNKCRGFAGSGTFSHLLNLNIEAVKVTPYWQGQGVNPAEFNCTISTGATLTMSQFEALQAKNAECKDKLAKYNAKKTAIQAKIDAEKNVRKIADMIDENGELKEPGKSFHWNEEKGNKYFGLGLTLDAGYNADLPSTPGQAICKTHLDAHGEIDAYVRAMNMSKSLFNARAELDTQKRSASFTVQLFGKSFYAPEKTWEAGDVLSFHPTLPHPKKGDKVEVGATLVIVVVPVSFKAGIAGEVGLRLNVDATASANLGTNECPSASLSLGVEPYAKVEGFVSVSIDAKILELGLRGYLTILELSFPLDFTGSLVAPGDGPAKLVLDTSLKSKMTTLSGRLELYGKVGFCPVCWKGSKTLVAWDGLSWNRTLFSYDYEVGLPDLALAFGYGLGDAEGDN